MKNKQTSPELMSRRRFLQVSGRYLQLFTAMSAVGAITNFSQAGASSLLTGSKKHRFLEDLQRRQLRYFLENQTECGLMLDRQHNHAAPDLNGITSTAATGMGLIAL